MNQVPIYQWMWVEVTIRVGGVHTGGKSGLELSCNGLMTTRRMFVIETASRACKITILIKRSKVRKVNHAFLPEGIQIEDLTQASCHA